MNATLSVSNRSKAAETSCCPVSKRHHPPPFLSRPSHFAGILIPLTLGMAYRILSEPEGTFLYRLGIYALFLSCLGAAILPLVGLSRVKEWKDGE